MTRSYRFVAGEDSLDALRLLRGGWSGFSMDEGALLVRLQGGASVKVHLDAMEIEPGLQVTSVVAEILPDAHDLPDPPSAFREGGHDVLVFRGVSWLESRPELGEGVTVQFSGPAHLAPPSPDAICDTTDAVVVLAREGGVVIRVGLKPGQLDVTQDPVEVSAFLETWGYGGG